MDRDELMKQDKREIIEALLAIIKHQTKKIAELDVRLSQNSTNGSRPPSSDIFTTLQNPRKSSGKKVGGQAGHKDKGFFMTMASIRGYS
ncbi:MAG: DUF6444 domain-containing protein [Euryarchaeota archaeon]|nr:DUF6444 domain-containing protein [Euryarchaeota archaeon]